MVFFKFIMAVEKSHPPKPLQKIPVSLQACCTLNSLPNADELFIVTKLACESKKPWLKERVLNYHLRTRNRCLKLMCY